MSKRKSQNEEFVSLLNSSQGSGIVKENIEAELQVGKISKDPKGTELNGSMTEISIQVEEKLSNISRKDIKRTKSRKSKSGILSSGKSRSRTRSRKRKSINGKPLPPGMENSSLLAASSGVKRVNSSLSHYSIHSETSQVNLPKMKVSLSNRAKSIPNLKVLEQFDPLEEETNQENEMWKRLSNGANTSPTSPTEAKPQSHISDIHRQFGSSKKFDSVREIRDENDLKRLEGKNKKGCFSFLFCC